MRALALLAVAGLALLATAPADAGGPCDRLYGTLVDTEPATWTMDDRCRHDVTVDHDCPNEAQWTKTWETEEVHPNLTVHYPVCRLG